MILFDYLKAFILVGLLAIFYFISWNFLSFLEAKKGAVQVLCFALCKFFCFLLCKVELETHVRAEPSWKATVYVLPFVVDKDVEFVLLLALPLPHPWFPFAFPLLLPQLSPQFFIPLPSLPFLLRSPLSQLAFLGLFSLLFPLPFCFFPFFLLPLQSLSLLLLSQSLLFLPSSLLFLLLPLRLLSLFALSLNLLLLFVTLRLETVETLDLIFVIKINV